MKPFRTGLVVLAAACLLGLATLASSPVTRAQSRIFFQISTGAASGTYFPIGELLAGIVSHPPGNSRCAQPGVCGPEGLIASTRTSDGAVANVFAVNSGAVDSGLAQADVIADAVAGKAQFAKTGAQKHLRVIASLYPEDVHLIAAAKAKIAGVVDLRGKRVSLGARDSGTLLTAREVLGAFRLSERSLKASYETADVAARKIESGQIDAMFFIGGAPVPLVEELLAGGKARLVPIDGDGARRLARSTPSLAQSAIAAGAYPRTPRTPTVSTRAIWVVNDSEPGDLVYGITRALFNPANRALLDQGHLSARLIRLETATANLPAPLHPGAARFYAQVHVLPAALDPAANAPAPKPRPMPRKI